MLGANETQGSTARQALAGENMAGKRTSPRSYPAVTPAELWPVLRMLTPLKSGKEYGPWASEPWAWVLADAMGVLANDLSDDPLDEWPEWELQAALEAQGQPLPPGMSIDQGIALVSDGLMRHYQIRLKSTAKDADRWAATAFHGMASRPDRDLDGARFEPIRNEPWMYHLALAMVQFASSERVVTGIWDYNRFRQALADKGLVIPDSFGPSDDPGSMLNAIEHVTQVLKTCAPAKGTKPEWFAANVEGPMNRRSGMALLGALSLQKFQDGPPEDHEFWTRSRSRINAAMLDYAAMSADIGAAPARLRAEEQALLQWADGIDQEAEYLRRGVALASSRGGSPSEWESWVAGLSHLTCLGPSVIELLGTDPPGAPAARTVSLLTARTDAQAATARGQADILAGAAALADSLIEDGGQDPYGLEELLRLNIEAMDDNDYAVSGPSTNPRVIDAALAAGRVAADAPDFADYCRAISYECARAVGYSEGSNL